MVQTVIEICVADLVGTAHGAGSDWTLLFRSCCDGSWCRVLLDLALKILGGSWCRIMRVHCEMSNGALQWGGGDAKIRHTFCSGTRVIQPPLSEFPKVCHYVLFVFEIRLHMHSIHISVRCRLSQACSHTIQCPRLISIWQPDRRPL